MSDEQTKKFVSKEDWNAYRDEVRRRGMDDFPRIFEYYGDTKLKKLSPGRYIAICPFHVEKTPSCLVSNIGYSCMGAGCGAKGDVFKFIMDKMGKTFPQALELLANDLGIPAPDGSLSKPDIARKSEPRPKPDPSEEFLADNDRLHDHDLRPVPRNMWVPVPGRSAAIWREEKFDSRTGEVQPAAIKRYKPEMVHEYRTVDDELIMAVLRLRFSSGKKMFFSLCAREPLPGTPDSLIKNGLSWQVRTGVEGRRPVYGAQRINEWLNDENRGPILLVEGEKCVDFALRMFPEPGTLVLSATGGFNASILADWKPLAQKMAKAGVLPQDIIVWPDNEPEKKKEDGSVVDVQELYAKMVMSGMVRDMKEFFGPDESFSSIKFSRVIPPKDAEKGWDIADAINEDWTRGDIESYMQNAVPVDMSHMRKYAPELAEQKNDNDASRPEP